MTDMPKEIWVRTDINDTCGEWVDSPVKYFNTKYVIAENTHDFNELINEIMEMHLDDAVRNNLTYGDGVVLAMNELKKRGYIRADLTEQPADAEVLSDEELMIKNKGWLPEQIEKARVAYDAWPEYMKKSSQTYRYKQSLTEAPTSEEVEPVLERISEFLSREKFCADGSGDEEHMELRYSEADALLFSALSAPKAQEWQPIETYTPVENYTGETVLFLINGKVQQGRIEPPAKTLGGDMVQDICLYGNARDRLRESNQPTHWMPLPKPPTSKCKHCGNFGSQCDVCGHTPTEGDAE